MEDKCRKDYRNQIRQIYEYLKDEYPEYYEAGTKVLTDEEKADQRMFHHRHELDLIYSGLNVKMVNAFLSTKKIKKQTDGVILLLHLFSHIRKYGDAIK